MVNLKCIWIWFKHADTVFCSSIDYSSNITDYNWLSLRRLVSWINHLPPAFWSTFWKSNFKQQLGCRFDIMDNKSFFVCVLTYAIIYVLIHQIIFRFYLLKYSLFFSSTLVLTSPIDVVFILSILLKKFKPLRKHIQEEYIHKCTIIIVGTFQGQATGVNIYPFRICYITINLVH